MGQKFTLVVYCCVDLGPLRVKRPSQQQSTLKAKLADESTIGACATIPPQVFVSVLISIWVKICDLPNPLQIRRPWVVVA